MTSDHQTTYERLAELDTRTVGVRALAGVLSFGLGYGGTELSLSGTFGDTVAVLSFLAFLGGMLVTLRYGMHGLERLLLWWHTRGYEVDA